MSTYSKSHKAYYEKNKEENKEAKKEYYKEYYKNHREEILEKKSILYQEKKKKNQE